MVRNIFFPILFICLSLAGLSQQKDSPGDTATSSKATGKNKSGSQKNKTVKKTEIAPPRLSQQNSSDKADAAYTDSLKKLVQEYESRQSINEKTIKELEKEVKQGGSHGKNKEEQATDVSTSMPVGLIAASLFLLLLTIFLFIKNRQMSAESKLRQQMIDNYSGNIEKLKIFLEKKGVLNPLAKYEVESIAGKIRELIDRYINEDDRNQKINTEMEGLKNKLKETLTLNNELQKRPGGNTPVSAEITYIPYLADTEKSYIKSEIILSAGPRKDSQNNDTELGEDIAGTISLPSQTFFWLLDGTSDSAAIKGLDIHEKDNRQEESHIFSSRLLAQSIGHYIQKNISRCFEDKIPLNELLTSATGHVSREWEKRLNNELPEKKEAILQMIRKGFKLLCSTTVIIGRLLDNGHLYALRTGDSKVFPFKRSNGDFSLDKNFKFIADPTDEYDRVAFRLDFDELSNSFVIKQNIPKWLTQATENVHFVFAFTDGIGRVTEAQLASGNPGIIEMIRQNIARIPQKTHDDKTLIILERVITT